MKTTTSKKLPRVAWWSLAVVAAFAFVMQGADDAQAQIFRRSAGLHIGGPNAHIDIGNPHGNRGYGRTSYYAPRTYYPQRRVGYYSAPRVHVARPHYDYHDTSHHDWHPTEVRRHGNHYDVQPGHWDFHREGHYDRHWGHH